MSRSPRIVRIDVDALVTGAYAAQRTGGATEWIGRLGQAAAEATDDHARGRLLLARAALSASTGGRVEPARADADQAVGLFDATGDLGRLAHAAALAAGLAGRHDDVRGAMDQVVRALVAVEHVADDEVAADVLNQLAVLCHDFFAHDRALQLYERSGAAARRLGSRWRVERSHHNIVETLVASVRLGRLVGEDVGRVDEEGRLGRAEGLARELCSSVDTDDYLVEGPRLLADVLCEQGRPEEAWLTLIGSAPPGPDSYQISTRLAVEARCLRRLGQPARAVAGLDDALDALADGAGDGGAAEGAGDADTLFLLAERSLAREEVGDVAGALADARAASIIIWRRQHRQIGRLVDEVWALAEVESERRHLMRSAEVDPLTDVGNRLALDRRLDRSGGHVTLAVLVVDIDRLSLVNDAFGRAVGDEVLARVAAILAVEVRDSDLVARSGADEFALVLDGLEMRAAEVIAERVRSRVAGDAWDRWGEGLAVTVSIGVAAGPGRDARRLLQRADLSLFDAKRAGGAQIPHAG